MNMNLSYPSARRTAAMTALAPLSWGTTYALTTEALPAGRPLLVAFVRVVPAGLVLVLVGSIRSRWWPHGVEWQRIVALGTCNFGLFFPLLFVAVYRLPGGVAAAVGGLQPLLVAAITAAIRRELPRRTDLAVGLAAAIGVGLVVVHPGVNLDPVGVLAAVGANVSFSMGVVLTKRHPTPIDRLAATGWQLLVGGLVLLVPMLALEGAPPALTGRNVAGFAYLSLVATAAAYVLWFEGIRRLPAPAPPLLGLAAPLTGATLGWVLLGQDLSLLQLLGFALTLGSIAYGATLGGRAGRGKAPGRVAGGGATALASLGATPRGSS